MSDDIDDLLSSLGSSSSSKKKSKKKSKKTKPIDNVDDPLPSSPADDIDDLLSSLGSSSSSKKKKSKKTKPIDNVDDPLPSSPADDIDDLLSSLGSSSSSSKTKSKKSKKTKPIDNVDDPLPSSPADDIDDLLSSLGSSSSSKKKKSKKSKKTKPIDNVDDPLPSSPADDIDDLLSSLGSSSSSSKTKSKKSKKTKAIDNVDDPLPSNNSTPTNKPSSSKSKSKTKSKSKSKTKGATKGKSRASGTSLAALRKKKARQAEIEKQRAEEERLRLEAIRQEEEEIAREEKNRLDAAAARKDARDAEITQLKREGLYVSKSRKKKQAQQKQEGILMKKAGLVPETYQKRDLSVLRKKRKRKPQNANGHSTALRGKRSNIIINLTDSEEEEENLIDTDEEWDSGSESEHEDEPLSAHGTESQKQPVSDNLSIEETIKNVVKQSSIKDVRSPILVVMGHVDTGKTKILDYIRNSAVQSGEEGGITQQIGATFFPRDAILEGTKAIRNSNEDLEFNLPGLLVIDTPGHESFSNLRTRGSSLCDIAILVVDIMHSLERQTIESLQMLTKRKVPFIVALNKVDQLFEWNANQGATGAAKALGQHERNTLSTQENIVAALKRQRQTTLDHFEKRVAEVKFAFQSQGLNAELYWENKHKQSVISLVPTSAHTGQGLPDLLTLVVQLSQKYLKKRLKITSNETRATVLEVKKDPGLGSICDLILSNGSLSVNDQILLCGFNGAIRTTIRSIVTPQPLKEMRVKSPYIHHPKVNAALGIRIAGPGLENAIAGSSIVKIPENSTEDEIADMEAQVMADIDSLLEFYNKAASTTNTGVHVQSSTLGALEALLDFLNSHDIPIASIGIGPVYKKHIAKTAIQTQQGNPQYSLILSFDVTITNDVQQFAKEQGVTIFNEKIIYHLFDKFTDHMARENEIKKKAMMKLTVWPSVCSIIDEDHIFRAKDPILVGVRVDRGILQVGTPLIAERQIPSKNEIKTVEHINDLSQGLILAPPFLDLGRVTGIQLNGKDVPSAKVGDEVSIRIASPSGVAMGRHVKPTKLCSHINRKTLDILKEYFAQELTMDDKKCVKWLKKTFWQLPGS